MQKSEFHTSPDFSCLIEAPLRFPAVGLELPSHCFPFFPLFSQLRVPLDCGSCQSSGRGTSLRVTCAYVNQSDQDIPLPHPYNANAYVLWWWEFKDWRPWEQGQEKDPSIFQTLCTNSCFSSAQVPAQFFNIWSSVWTMAGFKNAFSFLEMVLSL